MDARFYNNEEIDIEKLANDFENIFRAQSYETQQVGSKDQVMVQLKKGGDFAALIGLQTALSMTVQRTTGGVVAMLGQQKWMDKAAVGAVGLVAAPFIPILLPLVATAGVGAIKQANLANQVLSTVDGLVRQQIPGVQIGPLPVNLASQFQQYMAPMSSYPPPAPSYTPPVPVYTPPTTPVYTPPGAASAPAKPRCPSCNTLYEPGDTFCSGCGRALTPPRQLCPECKTEIKPGVAFCPKCGASTFQTSQQSPQAARPAPAKAPRPSTPAYTPPKPVTPVYTPPRPATPVYTPPRPETPVYTPPTSASSAPSAPTIADPQPYIPPTPQDPPVVPQPSITLVPGKPRAVQPTPPPAPPVPVYIPPKPVQPPVPQAPAPTIFAQAQNSSPTIKARPAAEGSVDANASWGSLILSNGQEIALSGERVLVGRYDHDLGGVQPEVDLGTVDGADTVSRGHATIEHIGSAYQLTDLNSTNLTRVNGKKLDPSVPTPITDGDTLQFGKISCTFKKG